MIMKILTTKPESLIEWPGHLSFVIFIGGCNFKCPFCYVPHLVNPDQMKGIKENEIINQINQRKQFIDAVCITGGEPTIHLELKDFLQKLKEQNQDLKIRLETNGSNPQMIRELIDNRLVDSIALDIKNSKEKYKETTNTDVNIESIEKTLDIIKTVDYEVRMTLVPGLHSLESVKDAAKWLENKGIKKLVLQQFKSNLPNQQTLDPKFMKKPNYLLEDMEKIKNEIEKDNFILEIRDKINN